MDIAAEYLKAKKEQVVLLEALIIKKGLTEFKVARDRILFEIKNLEESKN